MDGVQVFGLLHVALGLVHTGCVVKRKVNVVEGDVVLLRVERAALGTARRGGYIPARDEIDEGALSYADVSDYQDVAAVGVFGGGGTRTDALRPHGKGHTMVVAIGGGRTGTDAICPHGREQTSQGRSVNGTVATRWGCALRSSPGG